MYPKKKYGQNFLIDDKVLDTISNSFLANEKDLIIEIGPGMGALTKKLKEHKSRLMAYEIDNDMHKYLDKYVDDLTHIYYQDILKTNIKEEINKYVFNNLFIAGNLPYYITTPIIEHLINQNISYKEIVIMVQKEVGERFLANENNKKYGYFTIYLKYYFNLEEVMFVSKKAFNPIPKVDSMIIKLIPKKKEELDQKKYFAFLKECFKNKRKTLKNNLDKETFNKIIPLLNENNLDINVRAEQISEELFIKIFKTI